MLSPPAGAPAPVGACPACYHPNASFFADQRGYRFVRCAACGTVFLDPLPEPGEQAALHHDSFHGATTSYFAKVEKKLRRCRGRMLQLRRHVARGAFLDVGCSGGFMVEAAREAGFAASGVDVDPVALAYARRRFPENSYYDEPLAALARRGLRFDLVACSEVIEHVPALDDFVAGLAAVVRPGGYLFVTTPDITHWRRPALERWDAFCPPAHCVFLTPGSLRLVLSRHGFAVGRRRLALKPGIKVVACRTAA
ncbi:MAG: methyltransferase domain-containing protein [Alphaproteobacteria bacterium]|nr:methyltransferase domain-containing protein [Alphaproteobacteria bacterium]